MLLAVSLDLPSDLVSRKVPVFRMMQWISLIEKREVWPHRVLVPWIVRGII